jgi:outer membrane protein assembly factor BamA
LVVKALRFRTLLFPAFLFCALCAVRAAPNNPVFHITGADVFSERRVESLIEPPDQTADWQDQDWDFWAQDAAFLLGEAYHDEGYFDVRVSIHPPRGDTLQWKHPVVQVRIEEGERYHFDSVVVRLPQGSYPVYEITDLRVRSSKPFDKTLLYKDRRDLLKFYGDHGFLKAQAAESLFYDTAHKAVDVAFRVEPGSALVFDTLMLHVLREGDSLGVSTGKTSPALMRSLFSLRRGDTLSLKDINTFERKLKSTRAFNFVRVRDSSMDSGQRSALLLNAEEKQPGDIELSAFWENLYGWGGSTGWSHANMGGHLQEGHVTLTVAQRKQSLFLGYGAPLLFGTSVRFDNNFTVNWFQDQDLVLNRGWFHGNFEVFNESKLSRQLLPWLRVVSGTEFVGKSTQADSGRQRDFTQNYINSVFMEQLDDAVNPARGTRTALTWGNGGPILDNGHFSLFGNRHNWLEAENAAYIPAGHWLVLALRLDGGRFFGKGSINSERFFQGGPRSIRSEDWRAVCPEIVDTICSNDIEPAYFLASAELRFQPFQPSWVSSEGAFRYFLGLQLVPFADYGNVWEVGQQLTPVGQGRAVGAGLRYIFLSLFNIRIDYAWDPRNVSQQRFILDLSQAF